MLAHAEAELADRVCTSLVVVSDYVETDPVATTSFTITATPQGTQAKDSCGTMSVDQANRKTADGGVASCW